MCSISLESLSCISVAYYSSIQCSVFLQYVIGDHEQASIVVYTTGVIICDCGCMYVSQAMPYCVSTNHAHDFVSIGHTFLF